MTNIFTYGSLMCADIMEHVSGQTAQFENAYLDGYFRSHIREETYPAIVPQPRQCVEGIVYFDLKSHAISQLDTFEGQYYMRKHVSVVSEDNGNINAMAYIMKPEYEHLLTGKFWSFDNFLAHGKKEFLAKYVGFSKIEFFNE